MSAIYIALAGIMPLIAYFGTGSVIMLGLFAAAWFSPVFKKTFFWLGVALGVFMVGFTTGVYNGEQRVRAQWNAAEQETIKQADRARKDAERSVARKPSRWMPNRRDPYDRDAK